MKGSTLSAMLLAAGISALLLTACGNGEGDRNNSVATDSAGINNENVDTAAILPDTVPLDRTPPPGSPGGDSSRKN
ncbi:hypothetical protein [Chitinophaga nivalis]|uniref:Lipoprotein n=1 Tax=Chitinophaga nivalis TaxID=2991709 RepID=A0ABT3IL22_9BACT|nr:hypothetical protein [Chitinophaga nivalis]MCW3465640.1 hypothetical protein [Chitinophaga nivalis]MCW3484669.1 hypothetical protein [Chitinophaga nivalis]